ncbi:DUF1289 domain-containing protein [Frigidibacter mobilis]|uniref:DUF1289 domain-containing protein n=1 Tax=Frigidibacter mobilis TaxID=1335048 RepID=A0A159Z3E4_9RHOB|nr:DUF1289 domain-containing protein [Frigidibacter mobilis]AMY69571.1 hypothetical protein AKL17_2325 [Frigidibacter mobilis]
MMDDIWKRDEIESPCVKLCVMHPAEGICMGCYRTLTEIGGWSGMSAEARRAVMAELPSRAPRVAGARRGGREGRMRREG